MPSVLHAYIFDDEGEPVVEHVFYGLDDDDAQAKLDAHIHRDSELRQAIADNNLVTDLEEIDDADVPNAYDFEDDEDEEGEEGEEDEGPEDVEAEK